MFASAPLSTQPTPLPTSGLPNSPAPVRSDDASFAKLLSASAPAAPAPSPAAPAPQPAQASNTPRTDSKSNQPPRKSADSSGKTPEASKPADSGQDERKAVEAKTAGQDKTTDDDSSKDSTDESKDVTRDLSSLLGLNGDATARPELTAGALAHRTTVQASDDPSTDQPADDRSASQGGRTEGAARSGRGAQDALASRAAQRAADAGDTPTAQAQKADAGRSFADQLRDAGQAPLRTAPQPLAAATGTPAVADAALAAQQAASPLAGSGAGSDATPATGRVQAPVNSAGFSAELGARVSVLAADGVQQAELQLNPADMGPVLVQIVVDGAQAQVSFHAAQADTRQALEQSLPDLAAALQGSGLTLSGGGVFQQQAREQGDGGGGAGQGQRNADRLSSSDAVAATSASHPSAATRRVGLLDTFA